MIGTGIVLHQESIFAAHAISKTLAMRMISFQAVVGTLAALATGWLTDRYPAEKLLAAGMLMLSLAVASLYRNAPLDFRISLRRSQWPLGSDLANSRNRRVGELLWTREPGRHSRGGKLRHDLSSGSWPVTFGDFQ